MVRDRAVNFHNPWLVIHSTPKGVVFLFLFKAQSGIKRTLLMRAAKGAYTEADDGECPRWVNHYESMG